MAEIPVRSTTNPSPGQSGGLVSAASNVMQSVGGIIGSLDNLAKFLYGMTEGVREQANETQRGTNLYGRSIEEHRKFNNDLVSYGREFTSMYGGELKDGMKQAQAFQSSLKKFDLTKQGQDMSKLWDQFNLTSKITGMSADELGKFQDQMMGFGKIGDAGMTDIFSTISNTSRMLGPEIAKEAMQDVQENWENIMGVEKSGRAEYVRQLMATAAVYKSAGVDISKASKEFATDPGEKQLEQAAMMSALSGGSLGENLALMQSKSGEAKMELLARQQKMAGALGADIGGYGGRQESLMRSGKNISAEQEAGAAKDSISGLVMMDMFGKTMDQLAYNRSMVENGKEADFSKRDYLNSGPDIAGDKAMFQDQMILGERADAVVSQWQDIIYKTYNTLSPEVVEWVRNTAMALDVGGKFVKSAQTTGQGVRGVLDELPGLKNGRHLSDSENDGRSAMKESMESLTIAATSLGGLGALMMSPLVQKQLGGQQENTERGIQTMENTAGGIISASLSKLFSGGKEDSLLPASNRNQHETAQMGYDRVMQDSKLSEYDKMLKGGRSRSEAATGLAQLGIDPMTSGQIDHDKELSMRFKENPSASRFDVTQSYYGQLGALSKNVALAKLEKNTPTNNTDGPKKPEPPSTSSSGGGNSTDKNVAFANAYGDKDPMGELVSLVQELGSSVREYLSRGQLS